MEAVKALWAADGERVAFAGEFHRFSGVPRGPGPVQRPWPFLFNAGVDAARRPRPRLVRRVTNPLYPYSPIVDRPPLRFPGGRTLAVYLPLHIESFRVDAPVPGFTTGPPPHPMAYGWRDYGNRVGVWRLTELCDDLGIPVTALLNSEVCTTCPQIVEAGIARGWSWVAHGRTNSELHTGLSEADEDVALAEMLATFDRALPTRPRGWLGPGLTETWATPAKLAAAGFTHLLDWCCDDQPFPLTVPGLVSVPYPLDLNDMTLHLAGGFDAPRFERRVRDQFEVLLAESRRSGRVLAVGLHTFLAGQPHCLPYLRRILAEIASCPEVWLCTSDDLAQLKTSTGP